MPEINDAEYRQFVRYQTIGTPDEVEKKIRELEKDNGKQRDEIRDLKAKVPEEGTVTLSKERADALSAYEALGKPADLKAQVDKLPELEAGIARRDREAAREAAAKTLGIEGKDLASFAGADDLTYEVRDQEVERNGKKEKAPVAYVKDAEGKEHPLADFGKEKWGRPFEAVLTAKDEEGGNRYTLETAKGSKGTETVKGGVDDAIQKNHERARAPNPLRPATTT